MNKFLKSLSTLSFVVAASAVLLSPVNAQANNTPFFNSNTSNGNVGDETDFLRIGDINGASTIEACTDGTVIDLWAYVHNNAATVNNGDNFDGPGIAENTSLKLNVEQNTPKNAHTVSAVVNASNASAATDTVSITCGDREVSLEYVGVSNVFSTSPTVAGLGDFSLDGDPINGATIGYNGRFPGCNEYRAAVTMQVRVVVEDEPEVPEVALQCEILELTVLNAEKREYAIEVRNLSTVTGGTGEEELEAVSSTIAITGPSTNASFDGPTVNYTFVNDGTYTITGTVNLTLDGETIGSANCTRTVTFKTDTPEEPPVVTTPENPRVTTITNTGPGTNIALFAALVAASSFAYRKYAALRS